MKKNPTLSEYIRRRSLTAMTQIGVQIALQLALPLALSLALSLALISPEASFR